MKKTIHVRAPRNLTDGDSTIFDNLLKYTIEDLVVREISDAFVTFSGFTLDQNGLVKECHHDYDFQYQDYLEMASQCYNEGISNPDKLVILDDDNTYLQVFHPWFNYGHWLFDSLLRIWIVKDRVSEMILFLPYFYSSERFIQESIRPFKFKRIFYVPEPNSLIRVKNLCLPQVKPIVDSYHKKELIEIRDFYLDYVSKMDVSGFPTCERIYLSRKKSHRRRVSNENDVFKLLQNYGFILVYADDYGFFEQVAMYSKAKYLISIMGAGLSNALFMKEGSSILEFHKHLLKGDVHCKTFWYLADALEFDYYYQFCIAEDNSQDIYFADLTVDITLLEKNVNLMIENRD